MAEEKGIANQIQLVSFKLANEEFGVDIIKVQEIMRLQEITRMPQMPGYVEGVINLRGNVIPIIDLRKKFRLQVKERDNQTRIVVVNVEEKVVGFIVDAVEQVLRLSNDQIEPPPDVGLSIGREYLDGVGKLGDRLLILLNLDKLLSSVEGDDFDYSTLEQEKKAEESKAADKKKKEDTKKETKETAEVIKAKEAEEEEKTDKVIEEDAGKDDEKPEVSTPEPKGEAENAVEEKPVEETKKTGKKKAVAARKK